MAMISAGKKRLVHQGAWAGARAWNGIGIGAGGGRCVGDLGKKDGE